MDKKLIKMLKNSLNPSDYQILKDNNYSFKRIIDDFEYILINFANPKYDMIIFWDKDYDFWDMDYNNHNLNDFELIINRLWNNLGKFKIIIERLEAINQDFK